jgi:hypothetical protein
LQQNKGDGAVLQRLSPYLAAGVTTGLVIILGIWLMAVIYFNTYILGYRSAIDQKLVSAVIETSTNNPDIQVALKNQVVAYLKSPEGKAKMAETLKSPEMVKAMSENIQSPEMRTAIIKLMEVPEFRSAVLQIVKDTPEMRVLTVLSSAIVFDTDQTNQTAPSPAVLR